MYHSMCHPKLSKSFLFVLYLSIQQTCCSCVYVCTFVNLKSSTIIKTWRSIFTTIDLYKTSERTEDRPPTRYHSSDGAKARWQPSGLAKIGAFQLHIHKLRLESEFKLHKYPTWLLVIIAPLLTLSLLYIPSNSSPQLL